MEISQQTDAYSQSVNQPIVFLIAVYTGEICALNFTMTLGLALFFAVRVVFIAVTIEGW